LRAQVGTLKKQIKEMGDSPCSETVARREEVSKKAKDLEKIVESSISCSIEKAIAMTDTGQLIVEWNEDEKVYICNKKVVACDPGMRNTADFVTHSPDAMKHHNNWKISEGGYHTNKDQRFSSGCIYGNWWRYVSGQKKHIKKMTKRLRDFCPDMLHVPTAKTSSKETLLESYKYQVTFLPDMEEAYFSTDKWFQKTKMRKYVKTQQALERCVRAITGEKDKAKQKEVVVAYGDQSMSGCMRGSAPLLGNALVRKLRKDTTFFFVDESQTTKKCSCCHASMSDLRKGSRIKLCSNKDCIRSHWDRDINAAINILINFFHHIVHKERHSDFSRQVNQPSTTESTS
jgi:hypothetical protein